MFPRVGSRGLGFTDLADITPEEVDAFRASDRTEERSVQSGVAFLIDDNPGAQVQPTFRRRGCQSAVFSGIGYVALLNFDEGRGARRTRALGSGRRHARACDDRPRESIRENVLVARAFAAGLDDVLPGIGGTGVYGTEKLGYAYDAAGNILDRRDRDDGLR